MIVTTVVMFCCGFAFAAEPGFHVSQDHPLSELLTGRKYRESLDKRLSAHWENVELRTILRRISTLRGISIVRDRRIDPDRIIALSTPEETTLRLLKKLVASVQGGVSVTDNVVYLGPAESARKLRTLIAMRRSELFDGSLGIEIARRLELIRQQTFYWNDFEQPIDLVRRLGDQYDLAIEGLEHVPHDLWQGATLPRVSAVEGLCLVLIQFDLTFAWKNGATAIAILPAPQAPSLTRPYTPRRMTGEQAAQAWRKAISGLATRVERNTVIVEGTLEQHEALQRFLRPSSSQVTRPRSKPETTPLSRKRFTLRVKAVPVQDLMGSLESRKDFEIQFRYDVDQLAAAGIDLGDRIDIDVTKATIQELLRAVFEPLGIAFELDESVVTLKPKP